MWKNRLTHYDLLLLPLHSKGATVHPTSLDASDLEPFLVFPIPVEHFTSHPSRNFCKLYISSKTQRTLI